MTASLLALLQIADSAFPSGTFAHSYGLEQAARDDRVTCAEDVDRFVTSVLHLQVAGGDLRALVRASEAATTGDLESVCAVDAALYATKATEELRDASTAAGRRLLSEVLAHDEGRTAFGDTYLAAIEEGRTPGTHAVAFAVAGGGLDVAVADLTAAYLFTSASALWQAAIRVLPVSHRDVQASLHRLRPVIDGVVREALATANDPFTSFHPIQEIASMRHRAATVRMFAS